VIKNRLIEIFFSHGVATEKLKLPKLDFQIGGKKSTVWRKYILAVDIKVQIWLNLFWRFRKKIKVGGNKYWRLKKIFGGYLQIF